MEPSDEHFGWIQSVRMNFFRMNSICPMSPTVAMPRPKQADRFASLPLGWGGQRLLGSYFPKAPAPAMQPCGWLAAQQGFALQQPAQQQQQQQHFVPQMQNPGNFQMQTLMPSPGNFMPNPGNFMPACQVTPNGNFMPAQACQVTPNQGNFMPQLQNGLHMLPAPTVDARQAAPSPATTRGRSRTPRKRRTRTKTRSLSSSSSRSPTRSSKKAASVSDKLSSCYKYMGEIHYHGNRHCVPLNCRLGWITDLQPDINMLRIHSLEETQVYQLIYVLTNVPPTMRVSATRAKTKSALLALLKQEYDRITADQPTRKHMLSPDFTNLQDVAVKLGYDVTMIPKMPKFTERCSSSLDQVASFPPSSGFLRNPEVLALPAPDSQPADAGPSSAPSSQLLEAEAAQLALAKMKQELAEMQRALQLAKSVQQVPAAPEVVPQRCQAAIASPTVKIPPAVVAEQIPPEVVAEFGDQIEQQESQLVKDLETVLDTSV